MSKRVRTVSVRNIKTEETIAVAISNIKTEETISVTMGTCFRKAMSKRVGYVAVNDFFIVLVFPPVQTHPMFRRALLRTGRQAQCSRWWWR
jgi:hypothetical protein